MSQKSESPKPSSWGGVIRQAWGDQPDNREESRMTCKSYDIPKTLIWEAWLHVRASTRIWFLVQTGMRIVA
jgi:hypothetical protein